MYWQQIPQRVDAAGVNAMMPTSLTHQPSSGQQAAGVAWAFARASAVAVGFFLIAGVVEASLIRVVHPTVLELDWVSDLVLSVALGIAVYLWLHLRATRQALLERERAEVVIQAQLSMAEDMQRRLLPSAPPSLPGFEFAAVLIPAGRIGGDLYDFVETAPGECLVLVADVSGKGIAAAMALAHLRATFRSVAQQTHSPAELASRMSAAFYSEWRGTPYVTAIIGRFDAADGTLTYTNAGHPAGLLVRAREDCYLTEGGPPLGLLRDARFCEERMALTSGDVCVFVTDGVTEAFDEPLSPSRTRITATVRTDAESAAKACHAVMAMASRGTGPHGMDDWEDDRTVVVIAVHDVGPVRLAVTRGGVALLDHDESC